MTELDGDELSRISGGGIALTVCGITLGMTFAASFLYGAAGFLLTVNKALVACTLAVATSPTVGWGDP